MRLSATDGEKRVILSAMRTVSLAHGAAAETAADRATLAAAARITLGLDDVDDATLPPIAPSALADALAARPLREEAVRLAAVMALVDGAVDAAKIDRVTAFARALGIDDGYVHDLSRAAHGRLQGALGHMVRENMASITGHPWSRGVTDDVLAWLLPYRGDGADPALADRFRALADLPDDTFGRAFLAHFADNGYALPGEPDALNAVFSLPHDSAHVLAGYDTTPAGELMVSTFTAAMHPWHAMAAHVLPVLFSWHLGVKLNDVAQAATGAFQPAGFFEAWERGAASTVDLFSADWDFWSAAGEPLAAVRAAYAIAPRREGGAG